ncbi:LLM class F420-dependent oxidoreductase [Mycobacterium yunnanensis]|uniref:LLM class F420-dependent oxidoreductase n=1 Tax=Mycobacterium yunnanensis TaxID=368477 RepID=A0A9X2Z8W8_9MYCO|nr:LLM class F420-dependent oxidoreductase [Mycobacterium yunnanensis]MCV7424724.1 LLM class F420-dependent oxidoreductase [Mycobacterium yunnanensis]
MTTFGVVLPQTALSSDVRELRRYALAVEELGFTHVMAYDHVVGADPTVHSTQYGYDVDATFHEPLVTFGYLAALTGLELFTGVIILPQRQTALVAKQAAQVDLLSGGRLRLGVGVGWNKVEYNALGEEFSTRGKRIEEQVLLLRRLWTERAVTFDGDFDTITAAGLSPLPIQRPIPIWIGAQVPAGYRRAGRLADGWFPEFGPGPELDAAQEIIASAAEAAGRDPATLGMLGRVDWSAGLDASLRAVQDWREAGATHIAFNTMDAGLHGIDEHVDALAVLAEKCSLS